MTTQAYIFDVDGTLTPSRQVIDQSFLTFMEQFAAINSVYLVSGSDYEKTVEQLGNTFVTNFVKRVYSCSGNSVWEGGVEIYASSWKLPRAAINHLQCVLLSSKCPTKTGRHFEFRPGSVNFSTVGRGADLLQRQQYVEFDKATDERSKIVDVFNQYFGSRLGCVAHIGGETGIDITQTGADKQQILKDFDDQSVNFYGDRCEPGGNDYPLAAAILNRNIQGDAVHHVNGWQHTLDLLTPLL